ncbi:MAG: TIGR00725 family protein [Candidatus Margulisbacteria bacterium]|nr:TIGR00725 family protein [Candidatus Margulisiibacteriota bacterium]MBU1021458.1 TIGR00725 family protein [Candidatus Margulisiibacteriota bacterium]MBU1728379.1 TIGR00725 family protein [Candidatus Margulisiibacteriota bacterium]MBU1955878.1 TIGR00725 family protein [Candidatus Margulisiibacteriota bacterium]
MKKFISVLGESEATAKNCRIAEEVGRRIAEGGGVLVCGGLTGVMTSAAKGAKQAGGLTIGILPGSSHEEANPHVDIPIITGIGYARNKIVVKTGQVCIAIGGSYGTLSEIAFALGYGIPVIGLNTWELVRRHKMDKGIIYVDTPKEAVDLAFKLMAKRTKARKRTREKGV